MKKYQLSFQNERIQNFIKTLDFSSLGKSNLCYEQAILNAVQAYKNGIDNNIICLCTLCDERIVHAYNIIKNECLHTNINNKVIPYLNVCAKLEVNKSWSAEELRQQLLEFFR